MYDCFGSKTDLFFRTEPRERLKGGLTGEFRAVRNVKAEQAALRARWMAELAAAIEGAQRVAWQLGTSANGSCEARELYTRLEAARIELESLRLGTRRLREEIEPWLADEIGFPGTDD